MKQTLQLKLGQHLTMTPQLQQAIRLLQLSTLELRQEVQEALETNLMLESADGGAEEDLERATSTKSETKEENALEAKSTEIDTSERELNRDQTEMPNELPVDTAWDDIYEPSTNYQSSASSFEGDDDRDFLYRNTASEGNLKDHLMWQMSLMRFAEEDVGIATAIIDSINDDGYLACSAEEIRDSLLNGEDSVTTEEVEAVLHQLQNFDPPGVGARDLRESLLIQLRQFDLDTPWLNEALQLTAEYIELLATNNEKQLLKKLNVDSDQLREIVALIRSLNPRPGSSIQSGKSEYVIPDVLVTKKKGGWRVELNPDAAPKIRVNTSYAGLIRRADSSADNTCLKNHLQEARWFIKSLQSRHETLLKVATCIVEKQIDFFEHGEESMKPMVLRDVAEIVEMHESTISRVTTQKYMHTPKGLFEFKYFFSSHVGTSDGGECSATAIRALIKKLVAAEHGSKPLSDSKIATILKDQGINVARRTVAKYREALSIPPSNERKRLT